MGRRVTEDVKLADGTLLPKGAGIAVDAERMWRPDIWENPRKYDPSRFMRMRDTPNGESTSTLVSTSIDHFGFGLGTHACPGRFFGTAEVKIILSHLLLKYDFKVSDSTADLEPFRFGFSMLASHTAKLVIRRRKEEVSF